MTRHTLVPGALLALAILVPAPAGAAADPGKVRECLRAPLDLPAEELAAWLGLVGSSGQPPAWGGESAPKPSLATLAALAVRCGPPAEPASLAQAYLEVHAAEHSPALIEALGSPNPRVRAGAVTVLAVAGDPGPEAPLGELLLHGRRRAAGIAASPGAALPAAEGERGCLRADDLERAYRAAIHAARALGRIGGREAFATLSRALLAERGAYEAIVRERPPCPPDEEAPSEEEPGPAGQEMLPRELARAMVAAEPGPAATLLLQLLEAADADLMPAAVAGLSTAGDEGVTGRLFVFLAANPWYGEIAVEGLAAQPAAAVDEPLAAALHTEDRERVGFALSVLDLRAARGGLAELEPATTARLTEILASFPLPLAWLAARTLHAARADGKLLEELAAGDLEAVARHHVFHLLLGRPGTEAALAEALFRHGTPAMYRALRDCGNAELAAAADRWLEEGPGRDFRDEAATWPSDDPVPWGGLGADAAP